MVCPAFSTPDVSGNGDVLATLPSGDDIVDEIPVLRSCVHQRVLKFVKQLEHSVGNNEVVVNVEKPEIIVIDIFDSIFPMMSPKIAWLFQVIAFKLPSEKILPVRGIENVQRVSSS